MKDISLIPKYKSHKIVRACQIQHIIPHPRDGTAIIRPVRASIPEFHVSADYMTKHVPVDGGYYVLYEDTYESFSPQQAFEGGYTELTNDDVATMNPYETFMRRLLDHGGRITFAIGYSDEIQNEARANGDIFITDTGTTLIRTRELHPE